MKISILILLIIGIIICNGKTLTVYWSEELGVQNIEVEQGDSVVWKLLESDQQPSHLIKSSQGVEINGKPISLNSEAAHVFENIGTFEYECALHPESVKSIVTVVPQKYEYQGVEDQSNPYAGQLAQQQQLKLAYIKRMDEKMQAQINKRAEIYQRQQKQKENGFVDGDVVEEEDRNARQQFEQGENQNENENNENNVNKDESSQEKPSPTPKTSRTPSPSTKATLKPSGPLELSDESDTKSESASASASASDSDSSSDITKATNSKEKAENSSFATSLKPMFTLLLSIAVGYFMLF